MAMIKQSCADRIMQTAEGGDVLLQIIQGLRGQGTREGVSFRCSCPLCGSEHSLVVTPGKNLFKCFSCGQLSGKGAVAYLMAGERKTYPEALEYLAAEFNIYVEYEEERTAGKEKARAKDANFCARMLKESGLTVQDVTATVQLETDGEPAVEHKRTFIPGTLNSRGEIVKSGDDAIILYYDLDGRQVKYVLDKDKAAVERTYYRCRYQFPEEHKDSKGRAMKYKSPAGSPTFLYYPERIRTAYRQREKLQTLFIQEGEKKAEKACKHGLPSVAVSGIQNLGYKGTLPDEIIKLIEACSIQEVIFLLDSDCFDLTHNITIDDPVERRPKNFFYAVKNYKEYMNRLKNRNLYAEIYFGYVQKNEAGDKGVDDLLTNTLKGREHELLEDIAAAKNEKDMTGRYVRLHKITTATDSKIMEIWGLQSAQEFCGRYRDILSRIPEFTFGRNRIRFNEKGEIESAQPLQSDEIFWEEVMRKDGGKPQYNFFRTGAYAFLEHRGFYRYRKPSGDYEFIHVDGGVARVVLPYEIADYVKSFAESFLPKDILEMLYRGGSQYLGPDSLGNLHFCNDPFDSPARGVQNLYFQEEIWQITADSIRKTGYSQVHFNIWADQKKPFDATLTGPLFNAVCQDGAWTYESTELGRKCHFLCFLENASNFTWRKTEVSAAEHSENVQHLVAKLAAFGYLISSAKDKSCAKAVISMDGKQSDFGESNGRSGKSLMGEAVRQVTTSKAYNGKEFSGNAGKNQFIWDGITEKTNFVFIDDAQRSIDFELLFSLITGDWPVNPKGAQAFVLPFSKSPKILVTTNFAISGEGASYTDRQWQLAFSDFYNEEHKPVDDFGQLFFDEWDAEQWNLFWNLVAQCLQLYFRHGYVASPIDRLEKRKLMQEVGAEFDSWACAYFSAATGNLNKRMPRQEIYTALFQGGQGVAGIGYERKTFYSPQSFKKRLIMWCRLHGYVYNPKSYDPATGKYAKYDKDGRPVLDDKSNGIEYMEVCDPGQVPGTSVVLQEELDFTAMDDLPL